jgi:hypothetical protein
MLFTDNNKLKCVKRELTKEVAVMEVKLKRTESMQAATIDHVGSYSLLRSRLLLQPKKL